MKYLLALVGLFLLAGTAEANFTHKEWGQKVYGECIQTKCGSCEGTKTVTTPCVTKNGWDWNECSRDKVETKKCEVKEVKACEEEGVCPTECGLESYNVPDGQGGTKICGATEACVIPVVIKSKDGDKDEEVDVNVDWSQGSDGVMGDSTSVIRWKQIDGSENVEIAIAKDGIFGNGYHSIITKDDGHYWLDMEGEFWVKVRGLDDKSPWSEIVKVTP